MAGGMGRSGWGSLEERVARSAHAPDQPPIPAGAAEPDGAGAPAAHGPPDLKHCWVEGADGRVPGLLLDWRRDEVDGSWMGRVVRPVRMDGGAWWLLEDWLPAALLRPL